MFSNYQFAVRSITIVDMQVFRNQVSVKLLKLRSKLLSTFFCKKKPLILNAYKTIEPQKPIPTFVKKTLKKIEISCNSHSMIKSLDISKKLRKQEKIRDTQKKFVKIVAFVT